MVSPSIRLVLVLTLLQVYFLSSVHGLTLPLKTVTKCESFTKKSPNPKADCPIVDNIAAESSKPDKPFSTLLPTDISINSALNSARNGPLVNVKETLCSAPAIPKNASIIKPCLDTSPNSGLSSLSDSTCSSNPFGLKLPISVSNTVCSLPSPNLLSTPVASPNSCFKSGAASRSSVPLEDCVSASTVQSTNPSVLANSASTNLGLSCPNTRNSNAYSSGFKSSLTVSSTCSNANSASPNPCPVNSCGSRNTNVAPANSGPASLEASPVRPQNVVKQDVSLSLPALNQICSSNSGPSNLPLTPSNQNNMVSNNRPLTQSCSSNSLPVSQTCTKNTGSTISPLTNTCPSNVGTALPASLPTSLGNLPASQIYSKNMGTNSQTSSSNIGPTCQTNYEPKNLPVSCNSAPNSLPVNLIQQQQDCSSNIGLNKSPQGIFGSSGSNSLTSTQSIGSNNMLASQPNPANNSPAIPINSMSSNSGTNTIPVISNNLNTVTNAAQNTLCYPSSSSRVLSDSTLPQNFSPANQYQTTCTLTPNNPHLLPSNTGNNIVTGLTPSSLENTPSAGLSNSYAICSFENSINTMNKQNCPYFTSASSTQIPKCDGSCPTSIQQNYPSGLSINANSFGPNCQINQTPFPLESTKSVTPLIPIIKDPIIYPTIQTYPPPASVCPVTSPFIVPDQIPVAPIDPTISNTCPITPNCKTSINDYFKGVKAATSKLNDFISSFSNKFGIKSFPSMQSSTYSMQPPEILSQENTVTAQCSENQCNPGLPSYISRPKPTYFPAMQRNNCPCVDTTPLQQEQSPYCPILTQDFNQSEDSPLVPVESPSNATISTSPPNSSLCLTPVVSSPTIAAIPQMPSSVTFKVPVVPKTIVSSYNYPICPTSIANNFQDGLSSLSCNNNSPMPLSNLPTATPANLLSKLNVGSYNVPDTPMSFSPSNCYRPLSSILNGAKLTSPSTPTPIVSTYDDVTNILIPDVLSAVLPKKSCPCETCRKAFPFLSSISINTSPDCNTMSDCSTTLSNIDECSVNLSSNSCLSSDLLPSLDESQLDECCKNLENIIAMLELSLNLNGGFDCDLDAVPDILSTL